MSTAEQTHRSQREVPTQAEELLKERRQARNAKLDALEAVTDKPRFRQQSKPDAPSDDLFQRIKQAEQERARRNATRDPGHTPQQPGPTRGPTRGL